jgi:protein-S-isoprenylcysteine O-methyltransferase Ste14
MATGDSMVGIAMIVGSCLYKIHREEKLLIAEFGDEYRQFKAEVPMLVPLVF